MLQFRRQPAQHDGLDRLGVIGAGVATVAGLADARAAQAGLAGAIPVVHHHSAAAGAAAQQTRQQAFWTPRQSRPHAADSRFARADGGKRFVADNRKVGGCGAHVLARKVGPRDAPAGVRVLHHAHLVPDDRARVELVLQDARAAGLVAVERRGRPDAAARRWNALAVQRGGDRTRRLAGAIGGEDAPHDRRLVLVDFKFARAPRYGTVTVGATAGVAAVAHDAGEAASHLFRAILPLQLADQAVEADRRRIEWNAAGMNGADLYSGEGESLVDVGEVAHVARQPIGVLDDEHVERALPRGQHQRQQPVTTEDGGTRLGAIRLFSDDDQAFARGEGAT